MTEVLTRLLPAARDLRNPLAVGYSWLLIAWALLHGHGPSDSEVLRLYSETLGGVNDLWLVTGVTFVAVVLGSGIVRLMDRLMQLTRTRHGQHYNPLDAPEPFTSSSRAVLPRATGERNHRPHLADYLDSEEQTIAGRWAVSADDHVAREYELRLFRDVLTDDLEFGALQAEQLLRFSMIPPVGVAAVASFVWAIGADDRSPLLLAVALLALAIVLFLDYQRTGSLLMQRWHRLVRAYPDCLPPEVRQQRHDFLAGRVDSAPEAG